MRAIIDATGYRQNSAPILNYKPTPLLCVAGKPIIFHVVEFLKQRGITIFDIVLNHLPQKIERELGNGERWGVQITYHLAKDAQHPFQVIRPLAHTLGDEQVVFALGDSLPEIDHTWFQKPNRDIPILFIYPNRRWSGWGILPAQTLEKIPKNLVEEDLIGSLNGRYEAICVKPFLDVHSLHALKESNIRFLTSEHVSSVFPTSARLVEPGVWISRGVSLHPTAKIIPPVYIGEFCQINKEAIVGPNTIIDDYCIIDEGSDVVNSLICKRSYIGEGLNVDNCIIDRNLLISLELDAHVTIRDDFIIGESCPKLPFSWLLNLFERALAAVLLVVLSPLYLIMQWNHHLRAENMLLLPSDHDAVLWETFKWETFEINAGLTPSAFHRCFSRLPLLKGVVRGDIHFVGVAPRTPQDVAKMPSDWRKLYMSSKVGIITVHDLEEHESTNADRCYASESLYASHKGFGHDLQLMFKWLFKKCMNIWKKA